MIKQEKGFTLIELLITMVVFVLVMAAGAQIFTALLTQFKQQSKIAETNIEGIVGLEMLRQDIEHAGYGLPWAGMVTYNEASSNPYNLNDSTATAVPRAIVSGNNVTFGGSNSIFNGSDYLVIKAVNVAINDASIRWTTLRISPFTAPYNPRVWTPASENLNYAGANPYVIVLSGGTGTNERRLVTSGSTFYAQYSNITSSPWPPPDATETRIVYGVSPNTPLIMPFNRADYFIRRFDGSGNNITPQRCAPNTGVLEKAMLNHDQSGGEFRFLPLLDCVADMQVNFWLDTDGDGIINWLPTSPSDNIGPTGLNLSAQQIREQLKELRVYIVAHEGQRDINYDFSMNNAREALSADEVLGGNSRTIFFVNLKNLVGDPEYKYYRWKVYTLVVKPNNIR